MKNIATIMTPTRNVYDVPYLILMFQISMPFPEGGLVYDYTLDDGGASRIGEDEEEEEKKKTKVRTPFRRFYSTIYG